MPSLYVMIVEDEPLIAMAMQALVEDEGGTVLGPFSAVAPALKALESGPKIDCALMDFNLGRESSAAIADVLVARKVPFVFISGEGAKDISQRYAGSVVFTKPVEDEQLKRFLRQCVRP